MRLSGGEAPSTKASLLFGSEKVPYISSSLSASESQKCGKEFKMPESLLSALRHEELGPVSVGFFLFGSGVPPADSVSLSTISEMRLTFGVEMRVHS